MPQKKINSFFSHESSHAHDNELDSQLKPRNGHEAQFEYFHLKRAAAAAKLFESVNRADDDESQRLTNHRDCIIRQPKNSYRAINQSCNSTSKWSFHTQNPYGAVQKYQDHRKQQKLKEPREAVGLKLSQSSQFPASLETADGSQNNCPVLSEGQDSSYWTQRAGSSYGSGPYRGKLNVGNSAASDSNKFIPSYQMNKHYVESLKQEQHENREREMLGNFLATAKQYCEDANDIAKHVSEKLDQSSTSLLWKMKECLETEVPKLLQTIVENTNEKEAVLQKKLGELQVELEGVKKGLDTNQLKGMEGIVKCMSTSNENNHKAMTSILHEIKNHLAKPKPMLCEMASQYSPQITESVVSGAKETYKSERPKEEKKIKKNANDFWLCESPAVEESPLMEKKPRIEKLHRFPLADLNCGSTAKNTMRQNSTRTKNIRKTPVKVTKWDNLVEEDEYLGVKKQNCSTRLFVSEPQAQSNNAKVAKKGSNKKTGNKKMIESGTSGAAATRPQLATAWNFRAQKKATKTINLSKSKRSGFPFADMYDSDASDSTYTFGL